MSLFCSIALTGRIHFIHYLFTMNSVMNSSLATERCSKRLEQVYYKYKYIVNILILKSDTIPQVSPSGDFTMSERKNIISKSLWNWIFSIHLSSCCSPKTPGRIIRVHGENLWTAQAMRRVLEVGRCLSAMSCGKMKSLGLESLSLKDVMSSNFWWLLVSG